MRPHARLCACLTPCYMPFLSLAPSHQVQVNELKEALAAAEIIIDLDQRTKEDLERQLEKDRETRVCSS